VNCGEGEGAIIDGVVVRMLSFHRWIGHVPVGGNGQPLSFYYMIIPETCKTENDIMYYSRVCISRL